MQPVQYFLRYNIHRKALGSVDYKWDERAPENALEDRTLGIRGLSP